jgi:hypothetical protein
VSSSASGRPDWREEGRDSLIQSLRVQLEHRLFARHVFDRLGKCGGAPGVQLFESASTETISGPFNERGPAIQAQILVAGGENAREEARQDRGADGLGDPWTRPLDHTLELDALRDQMIEVRRRLNLGSPHGMNASVGSEL